MKNRKGQVSAELIIVMAAVLAVALILVVQLQNTAKEGRKAVESESKKVFGEIEDTSQLAKSAAKKANGADCRQDSECESGYCDPIENVCT